MTKEKALKLLLVYTYKKGYNKVSAVPKKDEVIYTESGKSLLENWTYQGLKDFLLSPIEEAKLV